MFNAGLGEPLHTNVELARPSDLQTAMNLTRAYERCLLAASVGTKTTTSTGS
jgi:hypothetical protein